MKDKRKKRKKKRNIQYHAPVWVCLVLIVILMMMPTGYQEIYREAEQCVAKVLSSDDSAIIDTGLVRSGEQRCELEILTGKFKGRQTVGVNLLNGSLEQDKLFYEGDRAQVVVSYSGDEILMVTMIDHNRILMELLMGAVFIAFEQDKLFYEGDRAQVVVSYSGDEILMVTMIDHNRILMELLMGAVFIAFLILFAGRTGIRAVLSFVLTVLAIWKVLVPIYLKGYNPIWVGLAFTLVLSVLIIALVYGFDRRCASAVSGTFLGVLVTCVLGVLFTDLFKIHGAVMSSSVIALVYGFDRRCASAVSGTFLGVLVTCVLGVLFTDLFKIHGAVMSSSESLLYAGYQDLNLTKIFMASVFIGASGALMDLSVDITSAVCEVVEKKPDIGWKEAVRSGMNVGRAAMGTMTTTLLFAYSGGYITLLMVFMAQGTPMVNILNYKYVAAEMIHTVIGSFGLVTVAPFTALCAGIFMTMKHKKNVEE